MAVAVRGGGGLLRRLLLAAGAAVAAAVLAVVGAVETGALEDNCRHADQPPRRLAALQARLHRRGIETLDLLVLMSGAAPVVVDRQLFRPPEVGKNKRPPQRALLA